MNKTRYILVGALSQFRIRYLVEVPEEQEFVTEESFSSEEFREFSQLHLGEIILDQRTVSRQEALDLFRKDNEYLSSWSDEQVWKTALNPIKEGKNR